MLLKIINKSSISINTATAIAVKNFRESLLSNISRLFFLLVAMSKLVGYCLNWINHNAEM